MPEEVNKLGCGANNFGHETQSKAMCVADEHLWQPLLHLWSVSDDRHVADTAS